MLFCSCLCYYCFMTHEEATKLIEVYGRAWETKDLELISSIFTDDVVYNDPREQENQGIEAVRNYWRYKVIEGQEDIKFEIKNVWVDGDVVIALWHANFKDTKRMLLIDMEEVAILTVRDGKFSSLKEYYKDVKTPIN